MRVRVLQAFSGNNSGSYVLVGTFREETDASALGEELVRVMAEHAAWLETDAASRAAASPLHGFATAQGIATEPDVGVGDEWPTYGRAPDVVVAGAQLLVFVDYSVTFPRFLGELVYRRGGRVSVELNHSHEAIVVSHEVWLDDGWKTPERAASAISAFRAEVESGVLDPLYWRPEDDSVHARPVVSSGFWPGMLVLVHAPRDVAEGVRAVGELVAKHGLRARFALFETPMHRLADPLGGYRGDEEGLVGEHQTVLWKPGPVIADTVRVVRTATGRSLAEATELVARAPIEVVTRVSAHDARACQAALAAVGADAEVLGPENFRKK